MANFIVRFQLESGLNSHYVALKRLVEAAGFTKIIKSDDGRSYILPQGMYLASTENDKSHVLDVAISCAKRIRTRYKILVTKSDGSAWTNLDPA